MHLHLIQDSRRDTIRSPSEHVSRPKRRSRLVAWPPPLERSEVAYRPEPRFFLAALLSALAWMVLVSLFVAIL